jgi:hypothetical protein
MLYLYAQPSSNARLRRAGSFDGSLLAMPFLGRPSARSGFVWSNVCFIAFAWTRRLTARSIIASRRSSSSSCDLKRSSETATEEWNNASSRSAMHDFIDYGLRPFLGGFKIRTWKFLIQIVELIGAKTAARVLLECRLWLALHEEGKAPKGFVESGMLRIENAFEQLGLKEFLHSTPPQLMSLAAVGIFRG